MKALGIKGGVAAVTLVLFGGTNFPASSFAATDDALKAFEVCAPYIDYRARQVIRRYRPYRMDGDRPIWLSERCRLDRDDPGLELSSKVQGCSFSIMHSKGLAYGLTKLIYFEPFHAEAVSAARCARRADAATYPLEVTPLGCPLDHRWEENKTIGWVQVVFDVDGTLYQGTSCSERPGEAAEFAHIKQSCPSFTVDLPLVGKRTYTAQRILIDTKPQAREIQPCQPTEGQGLFRTGVKGTLERDQNGKFVIPDTCGLIFFDYPEARQTLGARRWYADVDEEDREPAEVAYQPVTVCVPDPDNAIRHELRRLGYRNDDLLRVSFPVTDVFAGDRLIAGSQEIEPAVSYRIKKREPVLTGVNHKIGCETWGLRRLEGLYRRVDASEVRLDDGPIEAILIQPCAS